MTPPDQVNFTLSEKEKLNWLRLIRSENVSDIVFWRLLRHYGNAENALTAIKDLAIYGGRKKQLKIASNEEIINEYKKASKIGVKYLCKSEDSYPKLLKEIPVPPPIISILGSLDVIEKPSLAIIGSRRASANGLALAHSFAEELGYAGFTIISGLAKGIDTAAHKASVKTGTIAVVSGGIDYIYPAENRRLYYEILDNGGAIICDKPLGYSPRAADFLLRNRIIAGLSLGMLVVEANRRSGSINSANLANDYNRLVFSIPQNPLQKNAQGNNDLLAKGAIIALSPKDIITCIIPLTEHHKIKYSEEHQLKYTLDSSEEHPVLFSIKECEHKLLPLKIRDDFMEQSQFVEINDTIRQKVLQQISYIPININTLQNLAEISKNEAYQAVLELSLAGKINYYSNGNISIKNHNL